MGGRVMATDLRIRAYLRFPGDPPPDRSAIADPVTVPASVIRPPAPDPRPLAA